MEEIIPTNETVPVTRRRNLLAITLATALVAALASGGGVYYALNKQNNDTKTTLQAQIDTLQKQVTTSPRATASPVAAATATPTATANPTAGWKLYTDSTYGLSFKYPQTWQNATVTNETDVEMPIGINRANAIDFGSSSDSITISPVSAWDNPALSTKLSNIRKVYTDRAVSDSNATHYPIVLNAGNIAYSAPQYIESADGTYRGVYWYAQYGQDYNPANETKINLNALVVVMTDSQHNIFQGFTFVPGTSFNTAPCTVNLVDIKTPPCQISTAASTTLATYTNLVSTLRQTTAQ